jgi:Ca-activated chloride channel family protein
VFEFSFLWAFALLPAPLIVWWLLPPHRDRVESIRVPFFERVSTSVGASPSRGGAVIPRTWLQKIVAPLIWILLVTAMAGPRVVEPPIEKIESARDLLLAVDLSGSMSTRDMVDPDGESMPRLDAVKQVLDEFVARREGDRIGVVVFGNQALLQAPFTQDHDLVRAMLGQTRVRMAGSQTMLGDAIGLAINVFENSEAEDRVLVLLTDGNDSGSKVPPIQAAEIAADHELTVHTIAMGDPASTGEAEMDTETLEAVAAATGGRAFRADDREELEDIYRRIDELTPIDVTTTSYNPTRPLTHWLLGASILLALAYHLVMSIAWAARNSRGQHA